ncbi:MAG: crotonase [Bacteroidetes bacterium]|jgi:3-hydroxyacyl-CoA dehydrogenase/enoyl-CoA hydratase/3-hydroxybutyryl-CoA epimerase|nr:crotonase [Bacteroidota bacterium]
MPTSAPPALDSSQLHLEVDDGVATIWIDQTDQRVNTISEETLDALEAAIDVVEGHADVRAVVFISGKDDSFIAGANLDMLKGFETPADVQALSRRAHALIDRVQQSTKPTVAAINGAAMGGGLEMTLGCTYRIASTHDKTKMALPEVQLGLLPGGGGTQYLPRLVGLQQAFQMMLTGKNVYPRKAKRIGLVDALIHPPGLHRAAATAARQLANGTLTPERQPRSLTERLLESNPYSRKIVYDKALQRTEQETKGNYPAPARIVEAVKTGMEKGLEAGLEREATLFSELVFTPESKALVSLFFAKQQGDKNPHSADALPVRTLGILGAGLMGAGIAQVSAANGLDVQLKDQDFAQAAKGRKQIWKSLSKDVSKGIRSPFERDVVLERVQPIGDYDALVSADVVIEAVPESLELKRAVLSDVEAVVRPDCVIASNTSALPIAEIAEGAQHPERFIGMHYFSPVPNMPLLEIITTEHTNQATLATAYAAGLKQGKTVIVVNDGPGFYTTRILALYMNEALLLLEEGASFTDVDRAMEQFGFPMGPFELFDLVGIDVGAKITEVMEERMLDEHFSISHTAQRLADQGLAGQKTKKGFYTYAGEGTKLEKDEPNKDIYQHVPGRGSTSLAPSMVQERLALMMVNQAVRCLDEGILQSATDGDLGAVFGLGYPPFQGGPFRYVDQTGAASMVGRLEQLARQYGARFTPADGLVAHAENDTTFHG